MFIAVRNFIVSIESRVITHTCNNITLRLVFSTLHPIGKSTGRPRVFFGDQHPHLHPCPCVQVFTWDFEHNGRFLHTKVAGSRTLWWWVNAV
jgi:hypothetical protein